jgi:hypothetical protein
MKSRNLWIGLMVLSAIVLAVTPPAALAQDLPKSVDVKISTSDGSGVWYKNPIVIGGGVVLAFLLVALASRGGGTTVVKT